MASRTNIKDSKANKIAAKLWLGYLIFETWCWYVTGEWDFPPIVWATMLWLLLYIVEGWEASDKLGEEIDELDKKMIDIMSRLGPHELPHSARMNAFEELHKQYRRQWEFMKEYKDELDQLRERVEKLDKSDS